MLGGAAQRERVMAVLGLGYVGLPVAVAFAGTGLRVLGFDPDPGRVAEIAAGFDRTREVPDRRLRAARLHCSSDPAILRDAEIFVVAVPTPLTAARQPDLGPLLAATRLVAEALRPGALVIYESTVFPGATEEECVPLLEGISGLRAGRDFGVGYSPERINPGDPQHRLETITKVVAGQTPEALEEVAALYARIVRAGVHRASSIRVAEAAKVIENAQRDLNIAFVNELACIFDRLGLDTREVLEAAATKWNFLRFEPGLVGGHCIGVDPLYLAHRAERAGHHPEVILAGRRINDGMAAFVARRCVRMLMRRGQADRLVTVLGLTFKENVPDLRNSPALQLVREIRDHGLPVQLIDPLADPAEVERLAGIPLTSPGLARAGGAVVLAVPHRAFREAGWELVRRCLGPEGGPVLDVKSCLPRGTAPDGVELWRL